MKLSLSLALLAALLSPGSGSAGEDGSATPLPGSTVRRATIVARVDPALLAAPAPLGAPVVFGATLGIPRVITWASTTGNSGIAWGSTASIAAGNAYVTYNATDILINVPTGKGFSFLVNNVEIGSIETTGAFSTNVIQILSGTTLTINDAQGNAGPVFTDAGTTINTSLDGKLTFPLASATIEYTAGDGQSLSFTDGTNTHVRILDQGTNGYLQADFITPLGAGNLLRFFDTSGNLLGQFTDLGTAGRFGASQFAVAVAAQDLNITNFAGSVIGTFTNGRDYVQASGFSIYTDVIRASGGDGSPVTVKDASANTLAVITDLGTLGRFDINGLQAGCADGRICDAGAVTTYIELNSSITVTAAGGVLVDGQADVVQFTLQGHSTQTGDVLLVENSAGVDLFAIGSAGRLKTDTIQMLSGTSITVVDTAGNNMFGVVDEGASPGYSYSGFLTDARLFSGFGGGTARPILIGQINVNTTAVGNVGAGADDLMTYALPANSLVTSGRGVRIKAWGTGANNANAKTLTCYFGSTAILTDVFTISLAESWEVEAWVFRTGASTQDYRSTFLGNTGAAGSFVYDPELGTSAQDETATITIKCTGTAVQDNDIVQEGLLVEAL